MTDFYLRELGRQDVPVINRWRNDRQVIDHLGGPFRYVGEEVDGNWVNGYLANRSHAVRLAVCQKTNDEVVGAVYLLGIDWLVKSCEFAIWIGSVSHQGRGVGLFATQEALRHAFEDLNLNRVHLTVLDDNARAINLYRKVGFSLEGTLRQAAFKRGAYRDMLQMSMLADDYWHMHAPGK
ncbi:GNAT family protein [Pseudomonas sp. RW10S2]|uniref:GNAT family N-acetyltransferase n=1 Tax=Pseudomonas sp. RW10S2 TaxID=459637 RepID=UPI001644E901|nr:GNAT family N-acetyltransferase [Pseudomonas sp. RW10S2]